MRQVVLVLYTDDRRYLHAFGELAGCYGAKADMADQAPVLQLSQDGQGRLERGFDRSARAAEAQIDDIELLETEIAQIIVNGRGQVFGRGRRQP